MSHQKLVQEMGKPARVASNRMGSVGSLAKRDALERMATLLDQERPRIAAANTRDLQAAADKGNYRLAIEYYQAVHGRFPEDRGRSLWSSYEIAYFHHKMGQDEQAVLSV